MKVWVPEQDADTEMLCWWNDVPNIEGVSFVITPDDDEAPYFELTMQEARQLYDELGDRLNGGNHAGANQSVGSEKDCQKAVGNRREGKDYWPWRCWPGAQFLYVDGFTVHVA